MADFVHDWKAWSRREQFAVGLVGVLCLVAAVAEFW